MSEDDRALMERLAALELEVKADADAQRARKDAAQAKVREQHAAQEAERAERRARQTALVSKKQRPASHHDDDRGSDLGGALELATKASRSPL